MQASGGTPAFLRRNGRAAAALCAAVLTFLATTLIVHSGTAETLERDILLAMRVSGDPGRPLGPRWMQDAVRDLTAIGSHTVLTIVIVTAVGWIGAAGAWPRAWRLTAFAAAAYVANGIGKFVFARPRPDVVPPLVETFTDSFPSGHTFMTAVILASIAMALTEGESSSRRHYLVAVGAVLAVLIGISRIYLGVHWPTDVLAGWALGVAWAALYLLVEDHRAAR